MEFECDDLLRSNLERVFNERDRGLRDAAVADLYAIDAVLYEPAKRAAGRVEIGTAIGITLAALPADFAFEASGLAVGYHQMCCMPWHAGTASRPRANQGWYVAKVRDGLIAELYVFIGKPGSNPAKHQAV